MINMTLIAFVGAFLCGVLAIAIFFLQGQRSRVHWSFALGMAALAGKEFCVGRSLAALSTEEMMTWVQNGLFPTALLPGTWLLFSVSFARQNYRETTRKWRWVLTIAYVVPLTLALGFASFFFATDVERGGLGDLTLSLAWAGYGFFLVFLLVAVVILMNLEETLRASTGSKRWQIKFLLLGVGSIFAVQIYTISQTLLFSKINLGIEVANSCALIVAAVLIVIGLVRNRLQATDIYLSSTLVHNSITVLVVGVYLFTVGVLAKAISYVGDSSTLPLGITFVFVALLALVVLLLSDQLRHEVRRFISKNFYRSRYDYRKEWTTFTQRTTLLTDVHALCTAVCRMTSETFGIPSVTIWLQGDTQEKILLGGSTILSQDQGYRSRKEFSPADVQACLAYVCTRPSPVDFDRPTDEEGRRLRATHDTYFRAAQVRYGLPLHAQGQWLGLMTLNERLTRESLTEEDGELLLTIADQVGGRILNLQLSQQLVKAKELEAFQTLSTFFIHDLKNLASMLSLTMQNLPAHFDDPSFRQDALRVISNSVGKMNAMCTRLSLLTKKLELHCSEVDFNALISGTLADLNGSMKATLVQDLQPLPHLVLDAEQIQKVLINLVLNANDAVGQNGEICVSTALAGDHAVLVVKDSGCGMSKEFLEQALFRPFQTTKSQGLGIGLFQSKMIVEAHDGHIEVESVEQEGSTFRVVLPCHVPLSATAR